MAKRERGAVEAGVSPASTGAARVALVGCGRWGRHILRDLVDLGCEVVVADTAEGSRCYALEMGAAVVDDARKLPSVAGIVVATPTATHATVLEILLPRRVPIFCEKPLTTNGAEAARLAERAGDRLFIMDKWRYHPGVEMLRDLARSGEIGPVQGLETVRHGWANPHTDVDAVWILAPHDLSIALEILDELPAPRAATGERRNGYAIALSGVLGTSPWVQIDVSVAAPALRREVRLHCRDGVAALPDAYSDHIEITRPGAGVERWPVSTELPLRRELEAFLAHLGGGPPPRSRAADGAIIVQRLEQLRALAGLDGDGSP
jgi:predicted dehydrogenase